MARQSIHLHLFFTRVKNESRLEKSAFFFNSCFSDSFSVVPALLARSELISLTSVDSLKVVPGFLFSKRFLQVFPHSIRSFLKTFNSIYYFLVSFFSIFFFRPSVVSVHNPELLIFTPLLLILKFIFNSALIYEPHELEICKSDICTKKFRRFLVFLLENFFACQYDLVVAVSVSISDFYSDLYGLNRVFTLPNIPSKTFISDISSPSTSYRDFSLRSHFNISATNMIFIYQGLLTPARGIADLIDAFKESSDVSLVLMGYGEMEEYILKVQELYSNIYFLPAVPPQHIMDVTSTADFGIFYIPESLSPSRSYKYSMPNKFYEYIFSGVPVIVSDNLVDLSFLVRKHNLGYVCSAESGSINSLIRDLSKLPHSELSKFSDSLNSFSLSVSYKQKYLELMRNFSSS